MLQQTEESESRGLTLHAPCPQGGGQGAGKTGMDHRDARPTRAVPPNSFRQASSPTTHTHQGTATVYTPSQPTGRDQNGGRGFHRCVQQRERAGRKPKLSTLVRAEQGECSNGSPCVVEPKRREGAGRAAGARRRHTATYYIHFRDESSIMYHTCAHAHNNAGGAGQGGPGPSPPQT